jgi:hypothetical protein
VVLMLGGLPAGVVACPPPAQRVGAGHGRGGGLACAWGGGQSRVSSATAFFALASSMRSRPAAAAAMSAATAAYLTVFHSWAVAEAGGVSARTPPM